MFTPLGPNYGQESESKRLGINLYHYVGFSSKLEEARKMLESSNLRTKDSRMKVALYYNMEESWTTKEAEFTGNEYKICKIINDFNTMRWKEGYDFKEADVEYNVYFDIMEGRHRWVASICANENSRYDQEDPKIQYGSLNDDYIKTSLIQNNASEAFATKEWKDEINNSEFDAEAEVCKQVQSGKYGMKVNGQIKFTVIIAQLNSVPQHSTKNKHVSQEKFLSHMNDISKQSRISKRHVSTPTTLESLQLLLIDVNKDMLRKHPSRCLYSPDPQRVNLGESPANFIPITTHQLPPNNKLKKLAEELTSGGDETIISKYQTLSPDGILEEVKELKEYIENPNESSYSKLRARLLSFVETDQKNKDDLHKDYEVASKEKLFLRKHFYENSWTNTGKEERFKDNKKLNSGKVCLSGPFVLTCHNLLENKIKPKKEEPALLSLITVNHLLMLPLLHKCCRETNYNSANLKPDQLTNQLRYMMKYHSSFFQAGNGMEMK